MLKRFLEFIKSVGYIIGGLIILATYVLIMIILTFMPKTRERLNKTRFRCLLETWDEILNSF